eukprot:16058-Heterococcus_DN1.PRE.4
MFVAALVASLPVTNNLLVPLHRLVDVVANIVLHVHVQCYLSVRALVHASQDTILSVAVHTLMNSCKQSIHALVQLRLARASSLSTVYYRGQHTVYRHTLGCTTYMLLSRSAYVNSTALHSEVHIPQVLAVAHAYAVHAALRMRGQNSAGATLARKLQAVAVEV